jgi:hypothetical protein
MAPDDELARFQAVLLDVLASCDAPSDLPSQIAQRDDSKAFGEYVAAMEPRMLEVAAALMKKWGKRTPR